jgi:hypothetical protein
VNLLVIFAVGFASVFAQGFQSRNVNHGNYGWAAGTSMLIAIGNVTLWQHLAIAASWAETLTYGLSGACAITASMWTHHKFIKKG